MGLLYGTLPSGTYYTQLTLLRFRAVGTPLPWPEAKQKADHVRQWGIEVRPRTQRVDHILVAHNIL